MESRHDKHRQHVSDVHFILLLMSQHTPFDFAYHTVSILLEEGGVVMAMFTIEMRGLDQITKKVDPDIIDKEAAQLIKVYFLKKI